jgi:hypothetical protein
MEIVRVFSTAVSMAVTFQLLNAQCICLTTLGNLTYTHTHTHTHTAEPSVREQSLSEVQSTTEDKLKNIRQFLRNST